MINKKSFFMFFSIILAACFLMLSGNCAVAEDTVDFGDSSSSFLTAKAWEMYSKKDYSSALVYTEKCIGLYKTEAVAQQQSLEKYPEKKDIFKYWALNDVGTCYYIAGMASLNNGNNDQALEYFTFVVELLPYASCWDPKGWYWNVSEAAKKELQKLE